MEKFTFSFITVGTFELKFLCANFFHTYYLFIVIFYNPRKSFERGWCLVYNKPILKFSLNDLVRVIGGSDFLIRSFAVG